jgi:DNA-binding GntR family transcriptional regulator
MNYRRAAVAALAAGGLLVLGACGDPDNPQPAAQAQPDRGALEAHQRMVDAHERFQQAYADAAAVKRANEAHKKFQEALVEIAGPKVVVYSPASPDQVERRTVESAEARAQYRPFSADQIERRAVAAASDSAPWWTQKR